MNDILVLIVVVVTGLLAWWSKRTAEKVSSLPASIAKWYPEATRVSMKTGVPVGLILAVIRQESNGSADARGSAGEVGLMQLKQIAVDDLIQNGFRVQPIPAQDPEENILQGANFLKLQKRRAGNWFDALRAYNQGFSGMNRGSGVERSRNYAQSVMQTASQYGFKRS